MKKQQQKWTAALLAAVLLLTAGCGNGPQAKPPARRIRWPCRWKTAISAAFTNWPKAMDHINAQLAQLLVTTSHEQTLLGVANLWRQVYGAVDDLSGLPAAMHELESTDLLLNDVAEYSYYLMRKNVLEKQPLSENDWAQLTGFLRTLQGGAGRTQ